MKTYVLSSSFALFVVACASAPMPPAPTPCPAPAPVAAPACAACPSCPHAPAENPSAAVAETPPPAPAPPAPSLGKATGGPRGTRPCAFHESVDTYPRSCVVTTAPDGTLLVTAKGTALNPDHGFTMKVGGGPNDFDVTGSLDAFGICKGAFAGKLRASKEGNATVYEARFREHCKIVIR